jgi:DNA primase
LLDRLDSVIERGGAAWYARCPAHSDRSPSLSIKDAGDRVLIYCHAGCAADDVLAAVGLSFRDLYKDEWRSSHERAVSGAAWDYSRKTKSDPLDHERLILELAQAELGAGKQLSLEDQARVQLAVLRLKETA